MERVQWRSYRLKPKLSCRSIWKQSPVFCTPTPSRRSSRTSRVSNGKWERKSCSKWLPGSENFFLNRWPIPRGETAAGEQLSRDSCSEPNAREAIRAQSQASIESCSREVLLAPLCPRVIPTRRAERGNTDGTESEP